MVLVIDNKSAYLKPEQREAAHTLDRHVSVTAGPGAGKTTVLVERYLHILRTQSVSVDQLVAITFTNRAANEMRERLRGDLNTLLSSADPIERARWMRHKRTLDGAIITTIHGFCARLLREFPVEADVDPQFALLDAHQSAMLEEAIAEESLTEFINKEDETIIRLAGGFTRARLTRGLVGIYRSMRSQGITLDRLAEQAIANHRKIGDFNAAIEELIPKMREFIRFPALSAGAMARQRAAAARWPSLLDAIRAAPELESPAEFCEAVREFRDAARPTISPRIGDLMKLLDELIWEKNLRGRIPQIFLDLHARHYVTALIKVIGAIERGLDEEKRRRSVLDFDDLQLRTLRLLEQRPEVLRRTSSRYRFYLVDEFQDTNGLQRDLMAKLALGGTDFSGTDFTLRDLNQPHTQENQDHRLKSASRANLFIVGDRKQSIYGFRGADVDVFREMTSLIEARNGLAIPLNRNFRSQPPLIRFFNFLFERVFHHEGTTAVDQLNELGYVEHERGVAAREDQDALPLVELLIDLRPDDKAADRWAGEPPRERDGEQLARRIISLVGRESTSDGERGKRVLEYRHFALLFRAMTEVRIYESALRRACRSRKICGIRPRRFLQFPICNFRFSFFNFQFSIL